MATSRFHRPPRQLRSRETLDRILDSAEQVLNEKAFTEATLAEIMRHAGVTVGAFYRRFADKDALLHHLDERIFAELHRRADETLDPARWEGRSARDVITEFTRQGVEFYRGRRGLMRSLFLRARTDPVLQASALEVNRHIIDRLRTVLMPHRGSMSHPDPHRGIEIGFMMTVGSMRELIVFGEVWPDPLVDFVSLAAEVARMYCGYLGVA